MVRRFCPLRLVSTTAKSGFCSVPSRRVSAVAADVSAATACAELGVVVRSEAEEV